MPSELNLNLNIMQGIITSRENTGQTAAEILAANAERPAHINSPDNVVGTGKLLLSNKEILSKSEFDAEDRAVDKVWSKLFYHKAKLLETLRDRHALRQGGYEPEKTVSYHIREIRTWKFISKKLSL